MRPFPGLRGRCEAVWFILNGSLCVESSMTASRSSISEFVFTINQCAVGLCRLAALLFVLQIAIFAALGPARGAHEPVLNQMDSFSTVAVTPVPAAAGAAGVSVVGLKRSMFLVGSAVEVISRLTLVILVPLLGLLLVLSPVTPMLECKHLLLAMITVIGLLPLVFLDISWTPWAAGALPHLSNTLLIGSVVPLVATVLMMSVAVLLARQERPIELQQIIQSPAASRTSERSPAVRMGGEGSWIKSSPQRRRTP